MVILNLLSKRFFIFSSACLLSVLQIYAQSEIHRTENWITNSGISRLEHSNGYTMLSGFFDQVGPYTGSGVVTDLTTGNVDAAMPKINGDVYVAITDGVGGWYVGGYFDGIDSVKIRNLAHIKADKTVDRNWKPNPDNSPSALAINGTTLYVGGYFNEIAGQTRNYIASFDVTTGNLSSWNPNANNAVQSIEASGSLVYVGGYFSTIGGQSRTGLAAINASGSATSWAPVIVGPFGYNVKTMAIDATSIFLGGDFTAVGGLPRVSVARVNLTTGALITTWAANTNGYVNDIKLSGSTLFIGGSFTTINGISRNGLAAVNVSTGATLSSWNPGLDAADWVDDLSIVGNTIYFCGYFDSVNATLRNSVAAVDATNASLLPWFPNPNSSVYTVSTTSTNVFLGGYMNGVNWVDRPEGFTLLEDATDQAWPFQLDLNGGVVNTIAVKDNTLYIGGQFVAINKSPRRNLAAIDLTNGQVLPWNPSVFGVSPTDPAVTVYSIKIKDNLLYVGGKFLAVNAATRPGLAAVDLTTGVVNNWNPTVGDSKTTNEFVYSLDIAGNTVYVAGFFSLLGGNQTRANLAAVDATSGVVLPWAPISTGVVEKIRVTANAAYVVGEFGSGIGGVVRPHRVAMLKLDPSDAVATAWNPDFKNGAVNDIALGGADLYVGGYFDSVGVQPRPGLTSFVLATGNLTTWNPDAGSNSDREYNINALSTSQTKLYISGSFDYLGLENRTGYGEYTICPPLPIITENGSILTTSSSGSLQWYENHVPVTGATAQTFEINPLEYGVYAVTVTVNGCTARSEDFVYLITENASSMEGELNVYPNPVREELSIEISSTSGSVDFMFMDMMGRMIKNIQGSGAVHHISMREFNPGPYVLLIQTQERKEVRKIIKLK